MSLESNISKYYIYFVFRFSLFVAPIFTLFYFDLGYTLLETVFISSTVFYLTWVVFEIPTGIFADKFGRKKSMVIGSTFLVVGGLLIIWAPSFEALVVASFLTGLWGAFDSGASSALLYDSLKALKRENEFKKIQGNALFFAQVSLGLTALVGAYVYTLNIRYPFVLAFFGFCIALVASVLFEEPPIKKKNTSFVAHFLDSLSFVWKTPAVRWIVVYNSLIISFYFIFFRNLIQPYIQSVGVDILLFGIFFALFRFSAAVGSKFSVRFEKMLGGWRMLFLLPILFALSYLLMGIFPSVYGLLSLFLLFFVAGAYLPLVSGYINRHSPSDKRATILSIDSMAVYVFSAVLVIAWVLISDMVGLPTAIFISGITLLGITVLLFWKK